MSLNIIAVGKKHEPWVSDGVERYQKRLRKPFDVKWSLTAHSAYDGHKAAEEESKAILSRLDHGDFVILLDERGELIDSPALKDKLEQRIVMGHNIVFVIGGAYGVNDELHDRAQFVWSLSPLVFPHQLVRLMLIEQIYRAQEISKGGQYHHE